MKGKLRLLLQVAELSSSSYHDVSKEYPRELIDVITSIRGDNLSMVIVVSHKNSVIVASIPTVYFKV